MRMYWREQPSPIGEIRIQDFNRDCLVCATNFKDNGYLRLLSVAIALLTSYVIVDST